METYVQAQLTIVRGSLLDEVHQQLSPWISQVKKASYFDSTTSDIEPA